ncbi:MAG: hypothetical protein ACFHU9_14040 [Fluviicola sp.]
MIVRTLTLFSFLLLGAFALCQSNYYGQVYCSDLPESIDIVEEPDSGAFLIYKSDQWEDGKGINDYLWDHFYTIDFTEAFPEFEGVFEYEFVIESDGTITDFCFNKGVNIEVNAIMYAVWEGMPKWEPAVKDGKPVTTRQTMTDTYEFGD